jgi:AAA15 family ATPase/GTPase
MAKINRITVENFRGIKSPVIIDFNKGGSHTSALIYGRNGTGKSSIVDAWEWLLNAKIDSLSKEGISEKDYPHKLSNGNNVYINVDINTPQEISARATFNKTRIKAPIYSEGYDLFKTFAIYPNYLRYSDLQEFVYKSKGDKYKYIAKFFGLEQFIKNQSDIQSSLTKILNQHENLKKQLALAEKTVVELTNKSEINDTEIISFINTIASNYNVDIIDTFQASVKVKMAMASILEANPIATELAELKSFELKLNQFYGFSKIVQDCIEIEAVFNSLKQDE